ncbi:hypothetical protein NL676_030085 [Syzygium grande]|nr:hypothetical protein NL676_030085 [Syzygium grande]
MCAPLASQNIAKNCDATSFWKHSTRIHVSGLDVAGFSTFGSLETAEAAYRSLLAPLVGVLREDLDPAKREGDEKGGKEQQISYKYRDNTSFSPFCSSETEEAADRFLLVPLVGVL